MATGSAPTNSILAAVARPIGRVLAVFGSAWERRRVLGQLGALDDHMLRDIGITRQDVLSVMAEPLFGDPSRRLAERADESRQATRALARESLDLEALLSRPDPSGSRPGMRHAA